MYRLNKTESAVFVFCRFSLFLQDPFFQIILRINKAKSLSQTVNDIYFRSTTYHQSVKQCGSRSSSMFCQAWFRPKLFTMIELFAYLCCLRIAFANSLDPDQALLTKTSGLILSQNVWHSDDISERIFRKSCFWKKSADDKKSLQNYPLGKEIISADDNSRLSRVSIKGYKI